MTIFITYGILATSGFTPPLVNLESITAKPRVGRGSKNFARGKVKKAVCYFVHTEKATTDSSTDDKCLSCLKLSSYLTLGPYDVYSIGRNW